MNKQFIFAASAALVFCGCSFKGESISFSEPTSIYMGEKAFAKAHLLAVKDERADKNTVGIIKNKSGEVQSVITTVQELAPWFNTAFEREMRAAGFAPVSDKNNADFSYLMTVTMLKAEYVTNELTGKNLRLLMGISVEITDKNQTITKKYKYDEEKWIKPAFNADAIKKELEPFMRESVAATVKNLVEGSKTKYSK